LENGHDSAVLSSIGCGAFKNPPEHVAELFHEVIKQFDGYFKEIIFAIFDDHNSNRAHNPNGNLRPFVDEFKIDPKEANKPLIFE